MKSGRFYSKNCKSFATLSCHTTTDLFPFKFCPPKVFLRESSIHSSDYIVQFDLKVSLYRNYANIQPTSNWHQAINETCMAPNGFVFNVDCQVHQICLSSARPLFELLLECWPTWDQALHSQPPGCLLTKSLSHPNLQSLQSPIPFQSFHFIVIGVDF